MTSKILEKLEVLFDKKFLEAELEEKKRIEAINAQFNEIWGESRDGGIAQNDRLGVTIIQDIKLMHAALSSRISQVRALQDVQLEFLREIVRLLDKSPDSMGIGSLTSGDLNKAPGDKADSNETIVKN